MDKEKIRNIIALSITFCTLGLLIFNTVYSAIKGTAFMEILHDNSPLWTLLAFILGWYFPKSNDVTKTSDNQLMYKNKLYERKG